MRASILEKSRMSLRMVMRDSAEARAAVRKSRCSAVRVVSRASSIMPTIPFMGVRISWLILARNSLLARLAAWASSRDCCSSRSMRLRSEMSVTAERTPRTRPPETIDWAATSTGTARPSLARKRDSYCSRVFVPRERVLERSRLTSAGSTTFRQCRPMSSAAVKPSSFSREGLTKVMRPRPSSRMTPSARLLTMFSLNSLTVRSSVSIARRSPSRRRPCRAKPRSAAISSSRVISWC